MDKLELAKYLLEKVGMPPKQQSTLCCLALLAMAKLTKDTPCRQASNKSICKSFTINYLHIKR